MRVNPYATYTSSSGTTGNTREAKTELGKEEFLKILAAQFRGQNPLEPVKDTEFIAQMAQFSALEQLQNIAAKLDVFEEDIIWNQYLAMLGKEIHALTTNDTFVEGVVTGITFKNGRFLFEINGVDDYDIAAIISVGVPRQPVMPPEDASPEVPAANPGEGEEEAGAPGDTVTGGDTAPEAGSGEGDGSE